MRGIVKADATRQWSNSNPLEMLPQQHGWFQTWVIYQIGCFVQLSSVWRLAQLGFHTETVYVSQLRGFVFYLRYVLPRTLLDEDRSEFATFWTIYDISDLGQIIYQKSTELSKNTSRRQSKLVKPMPTR